MSFEGTALLVAWVAILLLAFGLAGLMRQVHLLRHALYGEGLGYPESVPNDILPTIRAKDSNIPAVLLFVDSECATCQEIIPSIEAAARRIGERLDFVLLFRHAAHTAKSSVHYIEHQHRLFKALAVTATPTAILVDPSGRVLSRTPIGSIDSLSSFLARVEESSKVA